MLQHIESIRILESPPEASLHPRAMAALAEKMSSGIQGHIMVRILCLVSPSLMGDRGHAE
jgi:predicted ATPase